MRGLSCAKSKPRLLGEPGNERVGVPMNDMAVGHCKIALCAITCRTLMAGRHISRSSAMSSLPQDAFVIDSDDDDDNDELTPLPVLPVCWISDRFSDKLARS